jgi:hypothetical protein
MKSFFIYSEKQSEIFDLTILMNELKFALKIKSIRIAEITEENKSQSDISENVIVAFTESFKAIILSLMTAINKLAAVNTKPSKKPANGFQRIRLDSAFN